MIGSLRGRVASLDATAAVIEVGGVGYLVNLTADALAEIKPGAEVLVFTEMIVREDSLSLYGFRNLEERETFRLLNQVTGIGPRMAMSVLSVFRPESLQRVVATGDHETLTTIPGIGKRGAARMIIELKDKFMFAPTFDGSDGPSTKASELREALAGLGYGPAELHHVMERVFNEEAPVEDLVKSALKELSRL